MHPPPHTRLLHPTQPRPGRMCAAVVLRGDGASRAGVVHGGRGTCGGRCGVGARCGVRAHPAHTHAALPQGRPGQRHAEQQVCRGGRGAAWVLQQDVCVGAERERRREGGVPEGD